MNKKRFINIIELFLQVGILILLFTYEGMELVENMSFKWAQEVVLGLRNYTFFDFAMTTKDYELLVLIGIMIVNAIICLVSIISRNKERDGVAHTVLATVIFILAFYYLMSEFAPVGYNVVIAAPFKIAVIVCGLLIAILAATKRSKYIVATEKDKTIINNINSDTSNADELKKYKDLLDSGVITQEEFDQKKKQLLGL